MSSQERRRSYSVGSIFSRNKSTYGLILPEEFQRNQVNPKMKPRKTMSCPNDEEIDSKDCFVPSELDNWELPQYQSLFHHLITQEGGSNGSRRLSSASSDDQNLRKNESGPIKAIQRWFKDFVHAMKHDSDEDTSFCEEDDDDMFPPSSSVVEGIPEDICEKLRYVHIYY